MNTCQKFLSTSLLALFSSAAFAQAPTLGAASGFSVLGVTAVTCTGSSISGDVGSSGAIARTDCTIKGKAITPVFMQVLDDFNAAYDALTQTCTQTFVEAAFTDATLSVNSGVICFPAAVTFTDSVLRLRGKGPWIFRVGTGGTGALTGTNLTVDMASGGDACDVFWQVAEAATLTTSVFQGNILAGAAITTTGGTVAGRLLAKAAVTVTGTNVIGCDSALPGGLVCKVKKQKRRGGKDDDDDDDDGDRHHDDDDDDDDDDDGGKNKKKKGKHPFRK